MNTNLFCNHIQLNLVIPNIDILSTMGWKSLQHFVQVFHLQQLEFFHSTMEIEITRFDCASISSNSLRDLAYKKILIKNQMALFDTLTLNGDHLFKVTENLFQVKSIESNRPFILLYTVLTNSIIMAECYVHCILRCMQGDDKNAVG